jgi:hypothetical protein
MKVIIVKEGNSRRAKTRQTKICGIKNGSEKVD